MAQLPTLPRRTWLERLSLAAAGVLTIGGVLMLAGWILRIDWLVQLHSASTPIKFNSALCVFCFGVVLLGIELGWARAAWFAVVPIGLGLGNLIEQFLDVDLHIDQWLVADHLTTEAGPPGRITIIVATCFVLAGFSLLWRQWREGQRRRRLVEAAVGSLVASVGFTTLIGFAANLPRYFTGPRVIPPRHSPRIVCSSSGSPCWR